MLNFVHHMYDTYGLNRKPSIPCVCRFTKQLISIKRGDFPHHLRHTCPQKTTVPIVDRKILLIYISSSQTLALARQAVRATVRQMRIETLHNQATSCLIRTIYSSPTAQNLMDETQPSLDAHHQIIQLKIRNHEHQVNIQKDPLSDAKTTHSLLPDAVNITRQFSVSSSPYMRSIPKSTIGPCHGTQPLNPFSDPNSLH